MITMMTTTMTKRLWVSLGLGALSLTYFLSACAQEDDAFVDNSKTTQTEKVLPIPKEGEFRFEIEADAQLPDVYNEQGRLLMRLDERPGYDNEFYPRTVFKMGDEVDALLVFVREKEDESEAPITFSHYTKMEVIDVKSPTQEDTDKGAKGLSNRLSLRENIPFPAVYKQRGYDFASDHTAGKQKWYVMALLGWTQATWQNGYIDATAHYGVVRGDGAVDPERYFLSRGGSSFSSPSAGTEFTLNSVPYLSNWGVIKIDAATVNGKTQYSGSNFKLVFQPQGSIIQVDVAHNISTSAETRRYGIASNVLNFSGKYDLTSTNIYERWKQRDANGENALPEWQPSTPSMGGYTMHYVDHQASGLSSDTEGMFPWHLPQFNSAGIPSYGKASDYAGAKDMNTDNYDVAAFTVFPTYQNSVNYAWYSNRLTYTATQPNVWRYAVRSGKTNNNQWNTTRGIMFFWGMPRKTIPANPATYVFTSAYSTSNNEDAYINSFNPQTRISKMSELVYDIRKGFKELDARIAAAKAAGDNTTLAALQEEYNTYNESWKSKTGYPYSGNGLGLMSAYSQDSAIFYGTYMPEGLMKRTSRTQPLVTLYQTTATFQERKIAHIQTALTTDLMFTKLIHKEEDGQNYSLIEIRNPTMIPVDLKQYAVARLIPSNDGTYLQYRKADGSGTDNLNEAAILPLKSVLGGNESPFTNSAFSAWNNHITGDYTSRYSTQSHSGGSSVTLTTDGMSKGKTEYVGRSTPTEEDGKVYLYKDQCIVLGASGYINKMPTATEKAWWQTLWNNQMYNASSVGSVAAPYHLLYHYRYADGTKNTDGSFAEGTLDMQVTDGFVLIKSNGKGGWQVIDATAPIGPRSMGSYVNYTQYKDWLATRTSDYFAITRNYGIQFPVLPPFSTARVNSDSTPDDWTLVNDEANFMVGLRHSFGNRMLFVGPVFWLTRTPIDPAGRYETYWRNIPQK